MNGFGLGVVVELQVHHTPDLLIASLAVALERLTLHTRFRFPSQL